MSRVLLFWRHKLFCDEHEDYEDDEKEPYAICDADGLLREARGSFLWI